VSAGRYDDAAAQGLASVKSRREQILGALPAAAANPEQAYALERSLGATGNKALGEYGKGYVEQDKAVEGRALRMALEQLKQAGQDRRLMPEGWTVLPDGRVFRENKQSGRWEIVGEPNSKPLPPPGSGGLRAGQHKMLDVGGVPVDHVFNGEQWVPTTIKTADGAQPPKPAAAPVKALSEAETKEFQNLQDADNAMTQLQSRFKDEYAGKGLTGTAQEKIFSVLGSSASPAKQEFSSYWADFEKLYRLGERHELFGSALTPTESKIWDSAQNARSGRDPQTVRKAMADMQGVIRGRLQKRAAAAKASYKSPGAVDAIAPSGAAATTSADDDLINKYLKK
jgi:hypothetical protein